MHSHLYLFAASSLDVATNRVGTSWPWYIIRAAGLLSALLIILLMISGIGQVTGLTYRFIEPIKAWAIHKAMAIALLISLAIHVLFILFDKYMPFTLPQILVPFLSNYNNGTTVLGLAIGGLAIAFGIFAMYGVVIIVASSLGWIDSRKTTWRWLHYVSYAVALLVFLHVLLAGTDVKYGTFRMAWVGLGVIVVLAILSRLRRAGSLRSGKNDPTD